MEIMFTSSRSRHWLHIGSKRRSIARTIERRLRLISLEDRIAPAGVTQKGTEPNPALVVRSPASTMTDRTDVPFFGPTNTSSDDSRRDQNKLPDLMAKVKPQLEASDFYLTLAEGVSLARLDNQI